MLPPNTLGGPLGTLPIEGGGATAITPQNGLAGTATPGANSIIFLAGSKKNTRSREYGKSSGSDPRFARKPIPAIGSQSSIERILISTVSPGSAPLTAIGPSSV